MENKPWLEKVSVSRREAIIGGAALVGGAALSALATRGVDAYYKDKAAEAERQSHEKALVPGNGKAIDHITMPWRPDGVKQWDAQITKHALSYDLDPNLVAIIMIQESGGDPHRVSQKKAKGLMQVTDPTAGDIASKWLHTPRTSYDLFDPDTSIEFGAAYLRYLTDKFKDASQWPTWDEAVIRVAAGYNGGPGMGELYRAKGWEGLKEYGSETNNYESYNYAQFVVQMWQGRDGDMNFSYGVSSGDYAKVKH